MSKVLKIRDINLGEGKPKICIPITGRNELELRDEVAVLKTSCCDVVEWRVDYFEEMDNCDAVKEMLHELRVLLGKLPILFTCRTKEEGGEKEISGEDYLALYKKVIETGEIDLIDVELFKGEEICREVVSCAHEKNVYVVMSSHDFEKTPAKEVLVKRFCKMRELGADVPKIATMPNCAADVLELLGATNEYAENYADCPVISMSMGWLGGVSRISGEVFGSALTFGAAKHVSAPGQIAVGDVNYILKVLHNSREK